MIDVMGLEDGRGSQIWLSSIGQLTWKRGLYFRYRLGGV
jgi:hypothetical protein